MQPDSKDPAVDRLIARLLVGKPNMTPDNLRQLVPHLREMDDHSLSQKMAYLRKKNAQTPPLA